MADRRTAVAERRVGEQRLHEVLAVVEGALDGDVVHVGRVDRGHLAALHVAHPTGRVEHDDVEACRGPTQASMAAEPGVARGGHDDGGPLAAGGQLVVEEAADELQGDVLEGQRRAPEELEQVQVAELDDRAHVGVVEGGVGVGDHRREVVARRSSPRRRAT